MTLAELVFPRNPGTVGQDLPGRPSPALLDMTELDYEGWATGNVNGRLKTVANPWRPGKTAIQYEVRLGDDADHWGGQRVETWPEPFDEVEGDESWFAFSWGLLPDFIYPTGWNVMFQDFSEPDGSPPTALSIDIATRDWVFDCRTSPYQYDGARRIAAAAAGHEHFFLIHKRYSEGPTGYTDIRHKQDGRPDPNATPNDSRTQKNVYHGRCHPAVTLYREKSSDPARYPFRALMCGFARAATAQRAMDLAWGTATTPTPPPLPPPTTVDVPSARAHLLQTLAWMTRTKSTGGLGYSVAKAKQTHVYMALVDLGGVWP